MIDADNFTTSQLHTRTCELVNLWDNITTSHTPCILYTGCELVNLSRPDNFTERTRTGLHALDAEPCRRADRDGLTPHGARTRGWRRHTGGRGSSQRIGPWVIPMRYDKL